MSDIISDRTVLAVVGLPGSGKTEATKVCLETGLFAGHIHFGQITFDEVKRRGLPLTEENERSIREELRVKYGMGAYAEISLPKIKDYFEKGNILIESHYSTEEWEILKNEFGDNFKVLAIYAPQSVRIKRLARRPERPLTAKEVFSRDLSQIKNTHQAGPIALADHMIINENLTISELKQKVLAALDKLNIKEE